MIPVTVAARHCEIEPDLRARAESSRAGWGTDPVRP